MATNQDKVKELIDLRNQAKLGGGEKRIESQKRRYLFVRSRRCYSGRWGNYRRFGFYR